MQPATQPRATCGLDSVSAAPFADNLPGPACLADGPLLTGPETLWASIAIPVVILAALLG